MNRLVQSLRSACQQNPLGEKILLAPNVRAGNQWLAQVARAGQPVVNIRVKTIRALALEWATEALNEQGLARMPAVAGEILTARAWNSVSAGKFAYFVGIDPSPGLFQLLHHSLHALRMAGVTADELKRKAWAGEMGKRADLAILFSAYLEEMKKSKYTDDAQIFTWAIEALQTRAADEKSDTLLVPAYLELKPFETRLILAWPSEQRIHLPCDEPDEQPTAEVQCSLGESHEVRVALRKMLERGWPLDQVELLYTDPQTYIPLIEDAARLLDLPVTFAEGLPAYLTRPGRSLLAWLEWIGSGYSQSVFVRMIEQGLLEFPEREKRGISRGTWAGCLRELPIQYGRERYLEILKKHAAWTPPDLDEPARAARLEEARWMLAGMQALLDQTPEVSESPYTALEKAAEFLRTFSGGADEYGNYARKALIEQIQALQKCFNSGEKAPGFSWSNCLTELPRTAHILGSGARAGHLHCAALANGGFTGRPYTILLGLDDSRMPGSGRQDPFVLDTEREKLSTHLELSSTRLQARKQEFFTLQGALRGERIFSCPVLDLNGEGARQESLVWAEARVRGKFTVFPESFVPIKEGEVLNLGDWWLVQTVRKNAGPSQLLENFPGLSAGQQAERQRASHLFTKYDGLVPTAGPALFERDKPWSSRRLELLGKCPRKYFYEQVLGLEPREELEKKPEEWMQRKEHGQVLHQVFQQVVRTLAGGTPAGKTRDQAAAEITERVLKRWREQRPVPAESVWEMERERMQEAVRILLAEDPDLGVTPRPEVYLEVAVGLPQHGGESELDHDAPVRVILPTFGELTIHGKIDRIEATDNEGHYRILDYKTGSRKTIEANRVAEQARLAQPFLYAELAAAALKRKNPAAKIESFSYFFPTPQERGGKLELKPEDFTQAKQELDASCQSAKAGAFPGTDQARDCSYCEFATLCGSSEQITEQTQLKLGNPDEKTLDAYRQLRKSKEEKKALKKDGQ